MEIVDSHLHIGNFSDTQVVTPEEVRGHLTSMGVDKGLVLPFAACGGGDDEEFHKLLYGEALKLGFHTALYVNPKMIEKSNDLSQYMVYPFVAIKIHPQAVQFNDEQIEQVCSIAESKNLPIIVHTGADECCHCERFRPFIKKHPKLIFVLCHARPANEAFPMMREYSNIWIDTAFLPFSELMANITEDVEDRIMFGTDFPANRWFPFLGEESAWYKKQITAIQQNFDVKTAGKILSGNFERLFCTNVINHIIQH